MATQKATASKEERNVIDDALLLEGLLTDSEGDISESNLVDLGPTVTTLKLSFKKIGRIENLVGFTALTTLCLDNNNIDEIRGLEHLRTLRWLDLSFNKIKKIKGLETLSQLKDLSLFSNKIVTIEGLESCTKLDCLSLGNNRITSLEQVIKLRQLRSLKMLAISGNAVCNEAEFQASVLAYVDSLQYLDYASIDPEEKHSAKEQYHDELLDVEEKESVVNQKRQAEAELEKKVTQLDKAGILFAHTMFDDMFQDDSDLEKLKELPGVKDKIEEFRANFKQMSDDFVQMALEKFAVKKKEIDDFESAVIKMRAKDDAASTQLIENFNKSNKAVVQTITAQNSVVSRSECQRLARGLLDELDKVCDELMTMELRQVEKFEAMVDEFDNRLVEAKAAALETQQLFFRSVEEQEDKFTQGVRGVITDLMERLAREELAEDFLDDAAMSLLIDKETTMGVVGSSHDMHLSRILKREDEARNAENKRYQESVHGHMNAEKVRNRNRVLEVHDYCRSCKVNISALLLADEDEDGDEEAK